MDRLIGRISNKPSIMKGGQPVLSIEFHRIGPRSYRHSYKLHVNSPGWNVWCKIKVKETTELINLMVEREEGNERKIFRENPHSIWEN